MATENSQEQTGTIVDSFATRSRDERIAAIEAHKEYAATQVDIQRLEGKINTNHQELQKIIIDAVSQTEIKTLKRFITFWVTVAGLVISIASTILSKITDFVWPR